MKEKQQIELLRLYNEAVRNGKQCSIEFTVFSNEVDMCTWDGFDGDIILNHEYISGYNEVKTKLEELSK